MSEKNKTRNKNLSAVPASGYPSRSALSELAHLSKIPDAASECFSLEIKEAIRYAHKEQNVKRLRLHPRDKILSILKRSGQCARQLRGLISDIDGVPISPRVIVGKRVRAALLEKGVRIEGAIVSLDAFATAIDRAATRENADQGRPPGTSYYPGFDLFVERLLLAAQNAQGQLTLYKSQHAVRGWAGTLLRALELLRPYLPHQFPPMDGISGKSLNRIARRFRRQAPKRPGGRS